MSVFRTCLSNTSRVLRKPPVHSFHFAFDCVRSCDYPNGVHNGSQGKAATSWPFCKWSTRRMGKTSLNRYESRTGMQSRLLEGYSYRYRSVRVIRAWCAHVSRVCAPICVSPASCVASLPGSPPFKELHYQALSYVRANACHQCRRKSRQALAEQAPTES